MKLSTELIERMSLARQMLTKDTHPIEALDLMERLYHHELIALSISQPKPEAIEHLITCSRRAYFVAEKVMRHIIAQRKCGLSEDEIRESMSEVMARSEKEWDAKRG